ncbi:MULTISPECIES: hypothetical protein [unclassified Halomonas]|nr:MULTISPECIES: hypothetical protein [unclassified Halomonas]MBR9878020.1 hypothetical protein [Gammaproteobacteria bacterium]
MTHSGLTPWRSLALPGSPPCHAFAAEHGVPCCTWPSCVAVSTFNVAG